MPQICPLLTGGVQIEWLVGGASLEIEIGPSGDMGLLGVDAAGNVAVEGDHPDPHGSPELITPALEHLSAPPGQSGPLSVPGHSRRRIASS